MSERTDLAGYAVEGEKKDEYSGPAPKARPKGKPPREAENVFFDIETIPDVDRMGCFPLESAPAEKPETKSGAMPKGVSDVLKMSINDIGKHLIGYNPEESWLVALQMEEAQGKNRQGVDKAIADCRTAKRAGDVHQAKMIKSMSVTPEFCRVVSFSVKVGQRAGDVQTLCDPSNEVFLLHELWDWINRGDRIIGFNCLAFDLPVIFFRSMLLGVQPSRSIDMRKYGSRDVLDLYQQLAGVRAIPKGLGSLDAQCKLAGYPEGDQEEGAITDGSGVLPAIEEGTPEALARVCRYNAIDVEKTSWLFNFYRGTYWI